MKNEYRITEVAKFFNISRQTLIYYDKIGLFKPHKVQDENSHRYYSSQQFSDLRFILTLKKSGLSLSEIKKYVQSKDRREGLEFLEEKTRLLQEKIEELKASKETIDKKISETKKLMILEKDLPIIRKGETIKTILVGVEKPYGNLEFERAFLSVSELGKTFAFEDKKYLITVDMENLKRGNYLDTKYLGLILPEDFTHKEEKILKENTVASIVHRGALKNIGDSYDKLKKYIDVKGYEIIGDSREIHNQVFVHLGDGAGTTLEIQIPVKKRDK